MDEEELPAGDRKVLTPELRSKFERKGEAIVVQEVFAYSTFAKRQAAVEWLQEKRRAKECTESAKFWTMIVLTAIAAFGAVWAGAVAKGWL